MANKNFNTQIRKKFDKGSVKKRGDLNFKTPAQKSYEKSKKQFNPSDYNITSAGGTKKTKSKDMLNRNPNKTMDAKTRKRLRDAMDRRRKKIPSKIEIDKKPKKNTIKDKINKVGNMKVKDAAKAVGKAILAGTPIGSAKNIADAVNKNFKFQSPIVRKNKKFGGR